MGVECQACGEPCAPGASFCGRCGTSLIGPLECAGCRHRNRADAAFCERCGASLDPKLAPIHKDECATWWPRLGAATINSFLLLLVIVVLVAGYFGAWWAIEGDGLADRWWSFWNVDVEDDPGAGSFFASYFLFFWGPGLLATAAYLWWEVAWLRSRHFAKPGQWLCGFRVVRASDCTPLTRGRAWGRVGSKWLILGSSNWVGAIASAFTIGLTERRQSVHDLMSGTACVTRQALAARGIGPDASDIA